MPGPRHILVPDPNLWVESQYTLVMRWVDAFILAGPVFGLLEVDHGDPRAAGMFEVDQGNNKAAGFRQNLQEIRKLWSIRGCSRLTQGTN